MKVFSKIINDETKELDCMVCGDTPVIDGYAELEREMGYDGHWYLKGYAPEKPAPTHDEIKEMRANAYQQEVDPITSHISRLKDEEQTEEVIAEIEKLKAERQEKRTAIKERFPYYE